MKDRSLKTDDILGSKPKSYLSKKHIKKPDNHNIFNYPNYLSDLKSENPLKKRKNTKIHDFPLFF